MQTLDHFNEHRIAKLIEDRAISKASLKDRFILSGGSRSRFYRILRTPSILLYAWEEKFFSDFFCIEGSQLYTYGATNKT